MKYGVTVLHKRVNKFQTIFGLPKVRVQPDNVCVVVYEIVCSDCNEKYIGQTGTAFTRAFSNTEHDRRSHQARVVERATNGSSEAFVTTRQSDALNRCELSRSYRQFIKDCEVTPPSLEYLL